MRWQTTQNDENRKQQFRDNFKSHVQNSRTFYQSRNNNTEQATARPQNDRVQSGRRTYHCANCGPRSTHETRFCKKGSANDPITLNQFELDECEFEGEFDLDLDDLQPSDTLTESCEEYDINAYAAQANTVFVPCAICVKAKRRDIRHTEEHCFTKHPCKTCKGFHKEGVCYYDPTSSTYNTDRAAQWRKTRPLPSKNAKSGQQKQADC